MKIYGESLCRDVPYKTLLLSIRDCAQAVVREMLSKYGLDKTDPLHYCLVQVNSDGTEYILDDDECPLSILMNHPTSRGESLLFNYIRFIILSFDKSERSGVPRFSTGLFRLRIFEEYC